MPRLLCDRERDILDLLLSVDFPGAVELRQQAASVLAELEGMIIDLVVSAESPRAIVANRTPVQAVVDGDGYDGGLLLFVDDGRLSLLEYWWLTEERPDVMPPLTAIGAPIASVTAPRHERIAADGRPTRPAPIAGRPTPRPPSVRAPVTIPIG